MIEEPKTRAEAYLMALQFLVSDPGHCLGFIDTEAKFAAAFIFLDLQKQGLATSDLGDDGPQFHITPAGVRHLRENGHD